MSKKVEKDRMGMIIREEDTPEKMEVEITEIKAPGDEDSPVLIYYNWCKKCGICVEACPVEGKALQFKNGRRKPPVYNYHECIRCFCCQEMCPHKAIQVK